jgi:Protein NO VEIN, C-terminal
MLERELRGEAYNKREHNRRSQLALNDRSAGAIEFKHQNISAVMIELGLPYIDGYKPRGNYQELLRTEVLGRLEGNGEIARITQMIVEAQATPVETIVSVSDVFVPPPTREVARAIYERPQPRTTPAQQVNYLEREARNRSLGLAGEKFVLEVEHRRLWEAGAKRLAERIEHVSVAKGDGLGFDIASFEADGRERLIEVKTTSFGSMTPFFASAKEVAVSESLAGFQLYRVFKFRDSPRIFSLAGSLKQSCRLEPTQFKASLP